MNTTTAPKKAPSPGKKLAKRPTLPPVSNEDDPRKMFMSAALDMSWRLALVVLIPLIGGFQLDRKLETLPYLTILGFIIAIAGMVVVVQREVRIFSETDEKKDKKS